MQYKISIMFTRVLLSIIIILQVKSLLTIHIIKKNQKTMANKIDQMNELLSDINDSTNNIAADLERIAGGITGGLTAEEADDVILQLQTAADKLKAVADTNADPEPPVEG